MLFSGSNITRFLFYIFIKHFISFCGGGGGPPDEQPVQRIGENDDRIGLQDLQAFWDALREETTESVESCTRSRRIREYRGSHAGHGDEVCLILRKQSPIREV
jgi:hypothetical protein